MSLELDAMWTFDSEFQTIFNKPCTYITFKTAIKHALASELRLPSVTDLSTLQTKSNHSGYIGPRPISVYNLTYNVGANLDPNDKLY